MICVELLQRYFHFISFLTSRYLQPIVMSWSFFYFFIFEGVGAYSGVVSTSCIEGAFRSLGQSIRPFLFRNLSPVWQMESDVASDTLVISITTLLDGICWCCYLYPKGKENSSFLERQLSRIVSSHLHSSQRKGGKGCDAAVDSICAARPLPPT